jgi:hypothetical protein
MSGRRSVAGAGGAAPGSVVMVPWAGRTVPGAGAIPLTAKSRHPARDFLDALQKLVIVRRLANARERGRGNSDGDTVCTVGRSVQLDFWMAVMGGLYFGG